MFKNGADNKPNEAGQNKLKDKPFGDSTSCDPSAESVTIF